MVLVATGVVLVSSLAAAGFGLFRTVRFSVELAESPTPSPSGVPKSQTVRKAPASLKVQQGGATNLPMAPDARALTTLEPGAVETRPGGGGSSLKAQAAAVLKAPATALPRQAEEEEANPRDVGSVVAEISLLRPAWTELRAGRPQAAVAIAREHAARYPTGALAQEREVVLIQALDQLGHAEEAKRQAEHFEQTFPDSPHRPKVHLGEPSP